MDITKLVEEIRKRYKNRVDKNGSMNYNEINEDIGTKTSGNWGHKGRPGEVGGSAPGGGHDWLIENRDTFQTKDGKSYATRWLKSSKKISCKGASGAKSFIQKWTKEHGDISKEAARYKDVLSTVKDFGEKNPEKQYVTCEITPPYKDVKNKRGYALTFHQNSSADDPYKDYTDDDYATMCAIARHELNSKDAESKGPYIGVYGNPEVSFVAEDVDDAMEFAVSQNQESIYDNKSGDTIENPFYKREYNPIRKV